MKARIINRFFNIFGHEVEIRILPHEYKAELKRIASLIDTDKFVEAGEAIEDAYKRWGCDHELVRLDSFNHFMGE